ncbi:DUF5681 domain-containing protein [Marinobacterium sp. xm-m-312]|uniref:DUF5681 domain-containing protein n=1 Tax=Marinobacterium sp. xm-m-312 TaxID=2497741 RepID=UPI001569FA7A|nr:DUF5681 domain-containing protein [Marinobacterium sp. xm-m-312]
MTDKQALTDRTNGRFSKGHSGNPKGRPPVLAPELRQRLHEATPEIIEKVVEKALQGDLAAAKIILNRTAPIPKQSSATVTIPDLGSESTTLVEKAGAILSSVASGDCPADVGAVLMQSVTALAKVIEVDELERRVAALEAPQ